jgi:hypothetical protein
MTLAANSQNNKYNTVGSDSFICTKKNPVVKQIRDQAVKSHLFEMPKPEKLKLLEAMEEDVIKSDLARTRTLASYSNIYKAYCYDNRDFITESTLVRTGPVCFRLAIALAEQELKKKIGLIEKRTDFIDPFEQNAATWVNTQIKKSDSDNQYLKDCITYEATNFDMLRLDDHVSNLMVYSGKSQEEAALCILNILEELQGLKKINLNNIKIIKLIFADQSTFQFCNEQKLLDKTLLNPALFNANEITTVLESLFINPKNLTNMLDILQKDIKNIRESYVLDFLQQLNETIIKPAISVKSTEKSVVLDEQWDTEDDIKARDQVIKLAAQKLEDEDLMNMEDDKRRDFVLMSSGNSNRKDVFDAEVANEVSSVAGQSSSIGLTMFNSLSSSSGSSSSSSSSSSNNSSSSSSPASDLSSSSFLSPTSNRGYTHDINDQKTHNEEEKKFTGKLEQEYLEKLNLEEIKAFQEKLEHIKQQIKENISEDIENSKKNRNEDGCCKKSRDEDGCCNIM